MTPRKSLRAEVAIAVLVCAGAQMFLAQPVARTVHAIGEQASAARSLTSTDTSRESLETQVASMRRIRQAASAVEERNQWVVDPARMLQWATSNATELGVRVEQLRPLATSSLQTTEIAITPPAPAPGATADTALPAPPPKDLVMGCQMTVSGPYHAVVEFIDRLQKSAGLARVDGVRLGTAGNGAPDDVIADIRTSHFAFDASAVKAAAASTKPSGSGGAP